MTLGHMDSPVQMHPSCPVDEGLLLTIDHRVQSFLTGGIPPNQGTFHHTTSVPAKFRDEPPRGRVHFYALSITLDSELIAHRAYQTRPLSRALWDFHQTEYIRENISDF